MENKGLFYDILIWRELKFLFKTYLWLGVIIISIEFYLLSIGLSSPVNAIKGYSPFKEIISSHLIPEDTLSSQYYFSVGNDKLLINVFHFSDQHDSTLVRTAMRINLAEVAKIKPASIDSFYLFLNREFPNMAFKIEIYPSFIQSLIQEIRKREDPPNSYRFCDFNLWLCVLYYRVLNLFFIQPYYAVPILVVIYLVWIKTRSVRRRLRRRFKTKRKILAAILLRRKIHAAVRKN